jgi:hypothetical protein
MSPSRVARIFCIIADILVTVLLIGFVEQQTWPARDLLQLLLFLLLWGEIYLIWSWGHPAEKKTLHLSGIFIILFSLLLIITMSEIFLRARTAYIPRQVMNALPSRGEYLRTDVFLFDDAPIQVGHRFHPNQNAPLTGQSREILTWNKMERFFYQPDLEPFQIQFITDENGYRNAVPLAQHYPVVVSGDSFTVGLEVKTPWTELLSQATGQPVLNLASVGYGPQAMAAAVRLYGLDKRPETIIITYFEGNDLRDALIYDDVWQQNMSFDQYQASEAPWNRQLVTLTALRLTAVNFARLLGLGSEPEQASPNTTTAVYPAQATIDGQEMALAFLDGYVAMLTAQRDDIERSRNWEVVTAALLESQQMAQENEARFILLYIPSKPHVYLPLMPAETANAITTTAGQVKLENGRIIADTTAVGLPYEQFMAHIDNQALALGDFAQSHNIEFLNLTPAFQAEAAQGQVLYLSLSTHWNPSGHQLAAQTVADYLTAGR